MRAVVASLASAVSTSMGKVNQQPGTPTPTPIPPFFPLACFSPTFSLITPLLSCWENRRILFYLRLKQFFVWSSLTLLLIIKQTCREILTPLSFPVGRNAARSMQRCDDAAPSSGEQQRKQLPAKNMQTKTWMKSVLWMLQSFFFCVKNSNTQTFSPSFQQQEQCLLLLKTWEHQNIKYPHCAMWSLHILCGSILI